jgi:hypothetical protein
MLTMGTESGVGSCNFVGAGNTSSVQNLDVDKVGVADLLTAVIGLVIMVIIVIERT